MMPVPLAIAAPAGLAALSYLDAKWSIRDDMKFITLAITNAIRLKRVERLDRVNMFYVLEEQAHAKSTKDKVYLWFEGRTWTFKQTYDLALQYANHIHTKLQVAPGEIVAVDCTNSPKFIFTMFALWSLGAKPAFINYNLTSQALVHCIRISTARVALYDHKIADKFTSEVRNALSAPDFRIEGKGPVELVVLDPVLEDHITLLPPHREPDSARSCVGSTSGHEKIAGLIFTSGTTGLPKPAIMSWTKLHTVGPLIHRWSQVQASDVYYTCMPLYHATALALCVVSCMSIGATCALGARFSNQTFWPEVRASKATVIQYVGETCRYLLAAPVQKEEKTGRNLDKEHVVRMALGNGMRPDVWERFQERFGIEIIAEFYTATEAPQGCWNLSRNSFTTGAVGRSGKLVKFLFGGRSAIVKVDYEAEEPKRDPKNNNFCIRVQTGEPGELIYALDPANIANTFQGYFGNQGATEKKILRDVFVKDDAYFRSGDLMRMDSEGRIYFVDRIGDTFRWRSENVSTSEVSEALGDHPAIDDANVYGVEVPHHDGRAGCAAITFNREPNEQLMEELAVYAMNKLPKYAVPIFIRATKDQMVTSNNKRQKHVFRNQGVNPENLPEADKMYWLNGSKYEPFSHESWEKVRAGGVKL